MQQAYKNVDEFPVTLTAKDIKEITGMSNGLVHALLNSEGFPTIKINTRKIVPKEAFIRWLRENTGKQVKV